MSGWLPLLEIFENEGIDTRTSIDQSAAESVIRKAYSSPVILRPSTHASFWLSLFAGLPRRLIYHCSEEPWIAYWFLNGLSVLSLNQSPEFSDWATACLSYISKRKNGAIFASSPHHCGHAALAYVSVNAIALAQLETGYRSIDRRALHDWFLTLKLPNGSFSAGTDLEADSRSTYCVIAVASLLNMLTPELTAGVADFLIGCQGYDGGFAPVPNVETHGGYGFTSVAALALLGELGRADVWAAIRWCAMRQMPFSGGFNGRTNKLVDSCYTWWVGAMARTLADYTGVGNFWNEGGLVQYVLCMCQSVTNGGVCDRPPSQPDMFHTMYSLAGLSATCRECVKEKLGVELAEMDTRYGITRDAAEKMKEYFKDTPLV
jgi:protein farnesyltransferase subunit beta